MIWLLIGYMWLFIHRPFEVWPVLGVVRLERTYMIFMIVYWLVCVEKRWTSNRVNAGLALLALSIVASAALSTQGSLLGDRTVEDWFKILVFYVLLMSSVRNEKDLRILITAFVVCFGLYMLHSFYEFLCGRHVTRMGIRRMTSVCDSYSPNGFAGMIVCALPMVLPVWKLCRNRWHRLALAGYVVLSVTCILLTGSRTGFVGLLSLGFVVAMLSRYRLRTLTALLVAAPLLWACMRDDLQNRFLTLINPSYGPANAQSSANSRWEFFKMSVGIWRENPVFGVGPRGFNQIAGDLIDREVSVHSLYGQLLGELGTVGILAFLALLTCYSLNGREVRRLCGSLPDESAVFLWSLSKSVLVGVVLLMIVGLGGHNLYWYPWVWYGAFQAIAVGILRRQSADAPDAAWLATEAAAWPGVAESAASHRNAPVSENSVMTN